MRKLNQLVVLLIISVFFITGCRKSSNLTMSLPEKYEGVEAELIDFLDSTILMSGSIENGIIKFENIGGDSIKSPLFTALMINGRIKSYYIIEPGDASSDTLNLVHGTPLNDKLSAILIHLDSVDNLDDMALYVSEVEKLYRENENNVIRDYLGVELLKFSEGAKVDSVLTNSSDRFRKSRRVNFYATLARNRANTAPGNKYTDFKGETSQGSPIALSSMVKPGNYTLIDFWASWCPYCIKELPELEKLYDQYKDKGLEIVGVAVRDNIDDTKMMVNKKNIRWPIIYNTQKTPYDIYGFAGIPHHILIGPDGTIISRGENTEQLRVRLSKLISTE